jgi:hypothetical protein
MYDILGEVFEKVTTTASARVGRIQLPTTDQKKIEAKKLFHCDAKGI